MSESVPSQLHRGLLLALGRDEAKSVFSSRQDEQLATALAEILAQTDSQCRADLKGQWSTLHRIFTGGSIDADGGDLPLRQCILGGRPMYQGDEMSVILVRPDMVPHISEALQELTLEELQDRLKQAQSATDDRSVQDAQIDVLTPIFESVRAVYELAASQRQAVLFCVRHID